MKLKLPQVVLGTLGSHDKIKKIDDEITALRRRLESINMDVCYGHPFPEKIAEMDELGKQINELNKKRQHLVEESQ